MIAPSARAPITGTAPMRLRCGTCRKEVWIGQSNFLSRPVEDAALVRRPFARGGIFDFGLECPECKHWHHISFSNGDMRRLSALIESLGADKDRQRKRQLLRRSLAREFKRVQDRMEAYQRERAER